MLGDPVKARGLGHAAREQATAWPQGIGRDVAIATAEWIEGEGAYRANDVAAAAPLITGALLVAKQVAPQSKLYADLLLSRARLHRVKGQPQQALADLQQAYNISTKLRDPRNQAKALQNIGSIYQDAQDYNRSIYYYQTAEELFSLDPALSLPANNNIANAYLNLGRLREAQTAYGRSLQLANKMHSPLLSAQILTNVADLAIERHNYPAAAAAISAGLKLTNQPAAASWRPLLLGAQAKLDFARRQPAAAVRDLQAVFAGAANATTDQSFSTVHLTAYRVYKAVGDNARALEHLEDFRRMDEEGRTLAASTNAALMTARFDFANQNARIATLKSGQLRRDVALTRLRARQSTVIFSSLLALLLTALIFLFVYLRSVRRSRNAIIRTNEQLAQTNADLGDALQAKSQFLATTSHEIRTPLNGILGMTQVILADRSVGGVVRDRIALVDSAGRAMRTLVDDILDFAKMDSGAVRLDAAPADLMAIIPNIVSLWRVQAQDKGIGLRLTMAGVEAPLLTDAARLRQVVFNLLSNAIKFTAEGEVVVDVHAESFDGAPVVTIAVRDTGIGIPPEAFETIFEPFRQLDTSTTRQFGGTGLGLAISRHLARVLGGDIAVASTPSGSTFTLRLPYTAAAANAPAAAPAATAVLIASDNPIRRSFLRTALDREFGSSTVCAVSDIAACLSGSSVSIIVCDVGDEATRDAPEAAVSALACIDAPPPLVLLVPEALADGAADWHAAGVARVVIKPLRVEALAAILREFVGGKAVDPVRVAS